MTLELKGIYKIKANLINTTGLHIGGSKESFEIGGLDNPVIKVMFPVDLSFIEEGWKIEEDMPYIPGSSLKGKMRSLLEWIKNRVAANNGEPCGCGECAVCKIFGAHKNNKTSEPVKLKVADAYPSKTTIEKWKTLGENIYTEVKTENVINRITSTATPRPIERVPAGSSFIVFITYEVFKDEDIDNFKNLFVAMNALQDNFLGGGGSRGNGRVIFNNIEIEFKSKAAYLNPDITPSKKDYTSVENILSNFEDIKNLAKGA